MPAPDDPSDLPPFTGMTLDRASTERKDPQWVRRMLEDPASQAVSATREGVAMTNGGEPALRRGELSEERRDEPILLGLEDGAPLFAVDLDGLPDGERSAAVEDADVIPLREAGLVLAPAEAGLAAYTVALLNWHRRHRFCANCGAETVVVEAGYSRRCPRCGANHFPRTDPCVIMTVEHDGRLLLGRRAGWPPGRLSVLAGFVSPGESAEEAVVREVFEESGIVARDPVFVASQPWPFPASLMLGFHAESGGGEPRASDGELEEVRWVDRATVRRALEGEEPTFRLPPGVSIARYLIERWAAAGS
ncbi:MAG TPA: NAD(+) diphosphatase [Solirubrobacteraceae bacterium]|jgi:NAD+ diphosphatase|nr:NAD(+) diphosphatase [Solirubrobacteraceae bacterium]